jgi:hypothetical protein
MDGWMRCMADRQVHVLGFFLNLILIRTQSLLVHVCTHLCILCVNIGLHLLVFKEGIGEGVDS